MADSSDIQTLAYYTVVQNPAYIEYKKYVNILNGDPLQNIFLGNSFSLSNVSGGVGRFLTSSTLKSAPSVLNMSARSVPKLDRRTFAPLSSHNIFKGAPAGTSDVQTVANPSTSFIPLLTVDAAAFPNSQLTLNGNDAETMSMYFYGAAGPQRMTVDTARAALISPAKSSHSRAAFPIILSRSGTYRCEISAKTFSATAGGLTFGISLGDVSVSVISPVETVSTSLKTYTLVFKIPTKLTFPQSTTLILDVKSTNAQQNSAVYIFSVSLSNPELWFTNENSLVRLSIEEANTTNSANIEWVTDIISDVFTVPDGVPPISAIYSIFPLQPTNLVHQPYYNKTYQNTIGVIPKVPGSAHQINTGYVYFFNSWNLEFLKMYSLSEFFSGYKLFGEGGLQQPMAPFIRTVNHTGILTKGKNYLMVFFNIVNADQTVTQKYFLYNIFDSSFYPPLTTQSTASAVAMKNDLNAGLALEGVPTGKLVTSIVPFRNNLQTFLIVDSFNLSYGKLLHNLMSYPTPPGVKMSFADGTSFVPIAQISQVPSYPQLRTMEKTIFSGAYGKIPLANTKAGVWWVKLTKLKNSQYQFNYTPEPVQWGQTYALLSTTSAVLDTSTFANVNVLSATAAGVVNWTPFDTRVGIVWTLLPPMGFMPINPGDPPLKFIENAKKTINVPCGYTQKGGLSNQGTIMCQNLQTMIASGTAASQYYASMFQHLKGLVNSSQTNYSDTVNKKASQSVSSANDATAGSKFSSMFGGTARPVGTYVPKSEGGPPIVVNEIGPNVTKSVPLSTEYESSILDQKDRQYLKRYVFLIPSALILVMAGYIALLWWIKKARKIIAEKKK